MRAKIKEKLKNVKDEGYVESGTVTSLTSSKGSSDIRMVYEATKSGQNSVIWALTFALPTTESLTDMLDGESWMADVDMGKQFLNFPLDPTLQPLCGINVRPYLGSTAGKTQWERWTRCMMGLCSSTYVAIKGTHLAEEMVFGNRHDLSNPFQWESVRLNLPGSPD